MLLMWIVFGLMFAVAIYVFVGMYETFGKFFLAWFGITAVCFGLLELFYFLGWNETTFVSWFETIWFWQTGIIGGILFIGSMGHSEMPKNDEPYIDPATQVYHNGMPDTMNRALGKPTGIKF